MNPSSLSSARKAQSGSLQSEIQRIAVRVPSSLHEIVKRGALCDVEKFILASPSALNEIDQFGQTPLHIAAFEGREDVVSFLVDSQADLSPQDKNGWTPLHCATSNHHLNIVERLITAGADPNIMNSGGSSSLHYLVQMPLSDHLILVLNMMLKKGANLNLGNEHGITPLHKACQSGSIGVVVLMLMSGANPDIASTHKECAIHIACRLGKQRLVEALIFNGADLTLVGPDGNAEETARRNGHDHIAEYIHKLPISQPESEKRKRKKSVHGKDKKHTKLASTGTPNGSLATQVAADNKKTATPGTAAPMSRSSSMEPTTSAPRFHVDHHNMEDDLAASSLTPKGASSTRRVVTGSSSGSVAATASTETPPQSTPTTTTEAVTSMDEGHSQQQQQQQHLQQQQQEQEQQQQQQQHPVVTALYAQQTQMSLASGEDDDSGSMRISSRRSARINNLMKIFQPPAEPATPDSRRSSQEQTSARYGGSGTSPVLSHRGSPAPKRPSDPPARATTTTNTNNSNNNNNNGSSSTIGSKGNSRSGSPRSPGAGPISTSPRSLSPHRTGSPHSPASQLTTHKATGTATNQGVTQRQLLTANSALGSGAANIEESRQSPERRPSPVPTLRLAAATATSSPNKQRQPGKAVEKDTPSKQPQSTQEQQQQQQNHSSTNRNTTSTLHVSSDHQSASNQSSLSPHKPSPLLAHVSAPISTSLPTRNNPLAEPTISSEDEDLLHSSSISLHSSRSFSTADLLSESASDTTSDTKLPSGRRVGEPLSPRIGSANKIALDRSSSDILAKIRVTRTDSGTFIAAGASTSNGTRISQPQLRGVHRLSSTEFGPRSVQRVSKLSKGVRHSKPFTKMLKDVNFDALLAIQDYPQPTSGVVTVSESMIIPTSDFFIEYVRKDGSSTSNSPSMFSDDAEATTWHYKTHFFDEHLASHAHWNIVAYVEMKFQPAPAPMIFSFVQKSNIGLLGLVRTSAGDYTFTLDTGDRKPSSLTAKKIIKLMQEQNEALHNTKFYAIKNPTLSDELLSYEKTEKNAFRTICSHKVGVVYVKEGQITEEEMLGNKHGSEAFENFLTCLGKRIELKNWPDFDGGLDTKKDRTGKHSIFATWRDFEIMFHVSTYIPLGVGEEKYVERKKHIANDLTTIIFLDSRSTAFKPPTLSGDFLHTFIVVYPKDNGKFGVSIAARKGTPEFGPVIPSNGTFVLGDDLREFILAKIINAERAALQAPMLFTKRRQARQQWLAGLINKYMPSK